VPDTTKPRALRSSRGCLRAEKAVSKSSSGSSWAQPGDDEVGSASPSRRVIFSVT
jgi:hypothetical protein